MNKIIVMLAIALSFSATAQQAITEGKVVSKQKMSTDNEQVNGQLALMGDMQSTTYFKNNKSRSEISNAMTGDVITIIDNDSKQMLMMMDNPYAGKKFMSTSIDPSEEDLKNTKVVKGDVKKNILGYDCNQYFVTSQKDGQEVKMEIFATDEISAMNETTVMFGEEFKGFPLYMKMEMNQMGTNMTIETEVTEINKETVTDNKFDMTPPEGYEKMQQ